MTKVPPVLASERTAAQLLDMKPCEFRSLVDAGHLPKPRSIGGVHRWDMPELYRIIRGEAVDGMGDVQWYLRFIRRSRGQSVMMKEEFGSPEFWDHYNRLLKGREPLPTKRNFKTLRLSYVESDAFNRLKPRTQCDYQKYMEHVISIWGDLDPRKIETHHIYKLHQANADHWRQANYLVQVLVVLLNHARLIGFLNKEHGNPAKGIPLFKQAGDGWEPDVVRAEFEELAPPREAHLRAFYRPRPAYWRHA